MMTLYLALTVATAMPQVPPVRPFTPRLLSVFERRKVESLLHDELSSTFGTRVGYLLSRQAYRRFRKRLDYSEYGGAPLVGVNGVCIVGHGRSTAKAVRNAVAMAARAVSDGFLESLAREMAAHPHA